jgi:dTDP-4-dehydrorhamnose reductase
MPQNKTVIIGSNGQLGTDLLACFTDNVAPDSQRHQITNASDGCSTRRSAGRCGEYGGLSQYARV